MRILILEKDLLPEIDDSLAEVVPAGDHCLIPTARAEIEMSNCWSRYFVPVTVIPAMVYSCGTVAFDNSSNTGSMDTGVVSFGTCASICIALSKLSTTKQVYRVIL
jgi:hypothetical protein